MVFQIHLEVNTYVIFIFVNFIDFIILGHWFKPSQGPEISSICAKVQRDLGGNTSNPKESWWGPRRDSGVSVWNGDPGAMWRRTTKQWPNISYWQTTTRSQGSGKLTN